MISEYRHTTIYCDLGSCSEAFEVSGWSFTENREQARKLGWRLGKDADYCPNCRTVKGRATQEQREREDAVYSSNIQG
jgi:hypothetical protein